MEVGEIIAAIKSSPLTDQELADIIGTCTVVTLSNALIGAGMDLLADNVSQINFVDREAEADAE